ncbi:MAG: LLM class flavin-dependent oxidoreductase [Candidatus Rokubacteria bacterium]|nr:LLM class flavin-dependent oxidoreductase [Candidatus Rokubacteria bacterium]
MAFGLTLPQRGVFFGVTTVPEMLALSAKADGNPLFDSVWVGDSLGAKPRPDSIALLGALVAATRRLRLGVGCMASFPVRDPLVFAYQWATLDLLSNGRMLLAACTGLVAGGASAREGASYGVVDRERADRLVENIEICRRLWSGERVSYKGRFRSFENVTLEPRPVQQPCPIWIASNPRPPLAGARLERALQRVAQMADGWMTTRLSVGLAKSNWAGIAAALERDGRDPGAFPTMAYHNVNLNPDRAAALEESKRFLDAYYGPVFTPAMVEAWTAAGTPGQCVEHLRGLRGEGMKSVALRITSWRQMDQFERLVGEVLPGLD